MIKNKSTIYKYLFFTYLTALFSLMTLTIKTGNIDIPKEFFGIGLDKIIHFLLFFPYSSLVWLSFNISLTRKFKKWAFSVVAMSGMLLGVSTELAQSFNPERNYDPKDMLVNIIAILFGTFFLVFICITKRYIRNLYYKN